MLVTPQFLKYNKELLAPILLNIFNAILATGVVPYEWKMSYIIPIPKNGCLSQIENYRGIAIQSAIPKIFDKLITLKLSGLLGNIIPASQHGFVKSKSTVTNLMETSKFINESHDVAPQVDIVYFDFSKAFDQVYHFILAKKMCQISIPYLLYWAYICIESGQHRSQRSFVLH